MRDRELSSGGTEKQEFAIIRRMRARRRLRIESGDAIRFNVAGFKVDRELGVAEYAAVENNLEIVRRWPDVLTD